MSPQEFADKLVDWVATVTQLDPEKGELPNVEDWRRNAKKLFEQSNAPAAALRAARETLAEVVGMLGHTSHWDSQGTHGANCPQCIRNSEIWSRVKAALAALGGEAKP